MTRLGLAVLGLDYRTAPLALREQLKLNTPDDVLEFLHELPGPAVVVATCHRVETYVHAPLDPEAALEQVEARLAARSGLSRAAVAAHSRRRFEEEAVRHAMEVAAGLQSAVLGEPQVLGQVRQALQLARRAGRADGVLGRLFEHAVHAGKRVRTEARLGLTSPSLARAAVKGLLERGFLGPHARLLVVGAGEMAMLALREAAAAGVRHVTVCARRPEPARQRAMAAVERAGLGVRVKAVPMERLGAILGRFDAVISATAAPGPVIRAPTLLSALKRRPSGRLGVVDLAVPRDVEAPRPLPEGLWLVTVDQLGRGEGGSGAGVGAPAAATPADGRADEVAAAGELATAAGDLQRAHAIVGQEAAAFVEWLRQRRAVPALESMRRKADELRRQEVAWAIGRLGDRLDEEGRRVVERMTERLTNKLLHLPTLYLKALGAEAATPSEAEASPWSRSDPDGRASPVACDGWATGRAVRAFGERGCAPDSGMPAAVPGDGSAAAERTAG